VKYLFLDSNIYLTCAMMRRNGHNPSLLRRVLRHVKKSDAILLVPEVVDAEVCRVLKDNPAERKTVSVLGAEGTQVVPLTPNALTRAMLWTIRGDKPARKNTDAWGSSDETVLALDTMRFKYGIEQDCLILASLSEFMSDKLATDTLVICTADKAWFANGELALAIVDAFSTQLRAYDDLTVVLRDEFSIDVDAEIRAEYILMSEQLEELQRQLNLAAPEALRSVQAALTTIKLPNMDAYKAATLASQQMLNAVADQIMATSAVQEQMQQTLKAAGRLFGVRSPALAAIKEWVDRDTLTIRSVGLGTTPEPENMLDSPEEE